MPTTDILLSDPEVIAGIAAIVFLILMSFFFSGSETALTAVSRARLYKLVVEGNKRAQQVSRLREQKESLIGAILLGNNAVNISASAIATALAISLWGDESLVYVTVIMTFVTLIFGEVLPKTYAIQNSERVALAVAPILLLIVRIFSPVTSAVQWVVRKLFKLFGVDVSKTNTLLSASDVIRGTIELHHKEGGVVKQDRDMLGGILDLNDTEVSEIMIHRKHVFTIDAALTAEEIIRQAIHASHSRIPLWQDQPDNIVGVLHVKSLLKLVHTRGSAVTRDDVLRLAVKPWFIPETTPLRDQLLEFRQRRQHFAFVVDEYGAWLGVATLEDVIEEIVGEIDDEHDKIDAGDIVPSSDGSYLVDGAVTLRDLNRHLEWNLPDEDASTVAGLIIHEARDIPDKGAQFEFHGYHFTIEDKQANQVTLVRIRKIVDTNVSSVGQ